MLDGDVGVLDAPVAEKDAAGPELGGQVDRALDGRARGGGRSKPAKSGDKSSG